MKRQFPGTKVFAAVIIAGAMLVAPALHASTLHAIMVGDTLDANIGPSDKIDMTKMTQLARTAAAQAGMQLNLITYMDRELPRADIMSKVQNLNPGPDDAVLFFYTGHGYRMRRMEHGWPAMALADYEGLDEMWVYNTLKAQRPRLLLVFMDACNGTANIPDTVIGHRSLGVQDNYRALFREARGAYMMSSSKPGEYSWADNSRGSYWTNQFLRVFNQAVSSSQTPTWDNIVKAAAKPIQGGSEQMTPQYVIQQISDSSNPVALDHTGRPTFRQDPGPGPGPSPGPGPGPVPVDPGGGGSGELGALMLQLEESIKWEAQTQDWRSYRGNWMASVRNAGTNVTTLRDALLKMEECIRWEAQHEDWRGLRDGWVSRVKSASSLGSLKQLVLEFEENLLYEAQYDDWKDERDQWMNDVRGVSFHEMDQRMATIRALAVR